MKGVIFEKAGAEPKVVDNLETPSPASDQVLVKSLWTAINPVDGFMAGLGFLVLDWPLVLAVDASGVVVKAGSEAESKYGLKPGTHVCGCTRLGSKGYAAGEEYFLMDAPVTMVKPKNLDLIQAATVGVGIETAALGLFDGLHVDLPDPKNLPAEKDEWIIVMGGASSVGKMGVQLAKAAGYKVLASCSGKSASTVESFGARTFDYKKTVAEQVKDVTDITGKSFSRIFDATASEWPEVAIKLLENSDASAKYFSTTNDWSSPDDIGGVTPYKIGLGPIGRPDATQLNSTLEKYIPVLAALLESGKVKPSEYTIVGKGGFEDLLEAYKFQSSGKAGSKKVVVKVQDE